MSIALLLGGFTIGILLGKWLNQLSKQLLENRSSYTSNLPISLLTGAAFGLMLASVPFSYEWIIAIPFTLTLIIVSVCDYRELIIPDLVTLPGIVFVLALRIFISPLPYWDYILAALLGGGIFCLLKIVGNFLSKDDSVGDGDIKLLILSGLVLGLKLLLLAVLFFCFLGFLLGIYLLLQKRYGQSKVVPFGPVIVVGVLASYFWGNDLNVWLIAHLLYI